MHPIEKRIFHQFCKVIFILHYVMAIWIDAFLNQFLFVFSMGLHFLSYIQIVGFRYFYLQFTNFTAAIVVGN